MQYYATIYFISDIKWKMFQGAKSIKPGKGLYFLW